MLLVLDNGSIFTQNLVNLLEKLSIEFRRISSLQFQMSDVGGFDSVILSGRRKNSSYMNALNSKIIRHAVDHKMPLLGICYGAEMIALTLGGTIRKMKELHKGDETVRIMESNPLCEGAISVFESHRFEISKLDGSLTGVASSYICKNEIICLRDSKIFGTQFHPEMSPDGHELIKKFLAL